MALGQVPKISSWISVYTPAIKHGSNMDQTWIKHGSNMACWKTFYFSFSDLFPSEAPSTSGISTKSRAAIDDTVCFGSLISHFHPLSWYILISETIYKTFIFPYHPWSKFDIFHDYHPSKATFFTLSLSPMKKTSIFLWFSHSKPPFSLGSPQQNPSETSWWPGGSQGQDRTERRTVGHWAGAKIASFVTCRISIYTYTHTYIYYSNIYIYVIICKYNTYVNIIEHTTILYI